MGELEVGKGEVLKLYYHKLLLDQVVLVNF